MGLKYLWDTNTVIYYLQNQFSTSGEKFINNTALNYQPIISVITEIELLCWNMVDTEALVLINEFIDNSAVLALNHEVKLKTIEVRKNYGLKLPDAVIAATAITADLILISNDKKGFNKVAELNSVNPFTIL